MDIMNWQEIIDENYKPIKVLTAKDIEEGSILINPNCTEVGK